MIQKDVLKHLQKLDTNKLPGPANIHPRHLKEIAEVTTDPLTRIFQTSLTSKELPADWKVANIMPVFKTGNHTKSENYQPISLTSTVFKVLDHLVNDLFLEHLTTDKILSPEQYEFQSDQLK